MKVVVSCLAILTGVAVFSGSALAACDNTWKPVCGVTKDGYKHTWSNACWAKMDGAKKIRPGACKW